MQYGLSGLSLTSQTRLFTLNRSYSCAALKTK